jgi:hypothetical protein
MEQGYCTPMGYHKGQHLRMLALTVFDILFAKKPKNPI